MVGWVFSDPAINDCAIQDDAQSLDKLVDRPWIPSPSF
jgi:hypothetical protein